MARPLGNYSDMTNTERLWNSILNQCTKEQQDTLEKIRDLCNPQCTKEQQDTLEKNPDLCKPKFKKEYTNRKRICYDGSKDKDVASIRLNKWPNNGETVIIPEIIIKQPWVTKNLRIVSTKSQRCGFGILADGNPENLGTVVGWPPRYRLSLGNCSDASAANLQLNY